MQKFCDFICKKRKLVILVSVVLLILSVIGSMLTHINYDILVYLPEENETIKGENILDSDFNMGAYSIAIIENMSSKDVLELETKIKEIEGVNLVGSLYDFLGTTIDVDMLPENVSSKIHKNGTDLLFITFNEGISSDSTLDAVSEIRSLAEGKVKFGGMSSLVLDTMELSNKEIAIYIVIAVLLCLIVLEFALDSYFVPVLLLGNIGAAILFNLGSNIFLGQISYITKALVAVLQLGVTTDFSIFLYHSYEKNKKLYKTNEEAMSISIKETFTSVTGSSLTTIAGFLVLCTMQLTLGRDLGIVMAKGVLFGVISVLTLFPSLLLWADKWIEKTKHKGIIPKFDKFNKFIVKHHRVVFALFLLLLIPAYLANRKVDVYYKIDSSLPENLESIVANEELKTKFNIVSPEIILIDKDMKSETVKEMSEEIKRLDGIDFVLSASNLRESGIDVSMLGEDVMQYLESDKYQLVLLNSLYDIASDELNEQITSVNDIVKKYDENAIVAGEGPLMKDLITISDTDFKNVNYSSVICITLILFFVLKSLSLPILLIITIEFAIFLNMGFSYFGGTVLPFVAPIVLGTIQLGATIDYAILITTTYLGHRKSGKEKHDAIVETMNYASASILVSGMCFFAATCGVGFVSKLEMVASICILISRGAIISMIVVMTVLPSILLIFDGLIMKTTLKGKDVKVMKKNNKKIMASIMVALLLTSVCPLPVLALSKDETVNVKLNHDGSIKESVINERLINDSKLSVIDDNSILENIMNVNNNSTFKKDGNKLSWQADGKDIFYQGSTDKELPLDVKVTYKLDGKVSSIEEMLGKSGKVSIELNFVNKDKHSVNIGGKYTTLYTPFTVTVGTIIDGENSSVKVNNGKIVNNGSKSIVMGIAAPGLKTSLNSKEALDMDKVVISYETSKFELASIYVVAVPKLIESSDLGVLENLDTLYSSMDLLKSNMSTIEKGSKTLRSGSNELRSKLAGSIDSLSKDKSDALNASQIEGIQSQAVESVKSTFTPEYKKALGENAWSQVKLGLNPSDAKVSEIVTSSVTSAVSSNVQTEVQNYLANLDSLGINFDPNVCASPTPADVPYCLAIQSIQNSGVNAAKEASINTASKVSMYVAENVSKSVAVSVAEETASLVAGNVAGTLAPSVANQVKDASINTIKGSLNTLYSGVSEIDEGIGTLSSGISKFQKEGINKLSDTVNGKVKNTADRMEALVKLGEDYETFDSKSKTHDGETKFVMIIDGKSVPKEKKVQSVEEKNETFFDRLKNLFK